MAREELVVAQIVESLARTILGRDIGPRTPRDARDESGLRVDFTYEACSPPVALEVTALHSPNEPELWTAIHKRLERTLLPWVEREQLGRWLIVLNAHADVKALVPELRDLMRTKASIRPGEYGLSDLEGKPHDEAKAFVEKHGHLTRLGLAELRLQGDDSNVVDVAAFSAAEPEIRGFSDRLTSLLADNIGKLGEAGDRERHLAAIVYDFHASRQPDRTPIPPLPTDLDYLWIIHTWPIRQGHPEVWVGRRGDAQWRREPYSLDGFELPEPQRI